MRHLNFPATALIAITAAACASSPNASPGSTSAPAANRGLDPELTTYAYPFEVRFLELDSQRQTLRLAYMDERPPNWNGQTVLLLHGKNFSGAYWAPTMRGLLERGYRVLAPDQVGFGKSSKPEAYQFSFSQLAANTRAVLDAAGVNRVAVVGHSMGGMLAVRFALQNPERVQRLALVNPIGLEDYQQLVPHRTVDQLYQQELAATPESLREYQRQAYYAGDWKPEYESLVEILAGWTAHPGYPRVAWNAALTADMIFTQPIVQDLSRLQTPTLLLIGQRDRTALGRAWAPKEIAATMGDYPALGRRTAQAIPGSKLVELPGVGHLPQVEAFPQYLDALTGFLAPPR